jgi:hypothetical protein
VNARQYVKHAKGRATAKVGDSLKIEKNMRGG